MLSSRVAATIVHHVLFVNDIIKNYDFLQRDPLHLDIQPSNQQVVK